MPSPGSATVSLRAFCIVMEDRGVTCSIADDPLGRVGRVPWRIRSLTWLLLIRPDMINIHERWARRFVDRPSSTHCQVHEHEHRIMMLWRRLCSSDLDMIQIEDRQLGFDRYAKRVKILIERTGRNLVPKKRLIGTAALALLPNMNDRFIHVGKFSIVFDNVYLGRGILLLVGNQPECRP